MRICIPKEKHHGENRAAMVPENAAKLVKRGAQVAVETGVGDACGYPDTDYAASGAEVVHDRRGLLSSADMVLRLRKPPAEEIGWLKQGCVHISFLDPFNESELIRKLAAQKVSAISMEMIPRITRAQKNGRTHFSSQPSRLCGGDSGGRLSATDFPDDDNRRRHDYVC